MWDFIIEHSIAIFVGWLMIALLIAMVFGRAVKFGIGND